MGWRLDDYLEQLREKWSGIRSAETSRLPNEALQRGDTHEGASLPAPAVREGPLALKIIAVLLIFYTVYFAASLLTPIAFALLLTMMLAPLVQLLERLYLPRALAALVVVLATLATLVLGIILLTGPAQSWIEKAPQGLRRIEQQIEPLRHILDKTAEQLQEAAQGPGENGPLKVQLVRPALTELALGALKSRPPSSRSSY
jgi:predicted PurR-regulated permease PerM